MTDHMNRSGIEVTSLEQQLLQTDDQEFIMAFLHRQKHVWKNQEMSEFVDNYFEKSLNTKDLSAALKQYLHQLRIHAEVDETEVSFQGVRNQSPLMSDEFFRDLAFVYREQLLVRESLQSFENYLDDKLHCLNTWTKVTAVSFTAAAAISAVVAAAAAKGVRAAVAMGAGPILFGAICTWMLALLKKHKNAVNIQKKIICFMIVGADIIIKDLSNVYALGRRLQFHTESLSEMVDEGAAEVAFRKKLVAFNESFQELQCQSNDYGRDIHWARAVVIQSIIHSNY
ncbi:hypothetical protein C2S52_011252 [Perilla frutescens var. hirtella]|nr:hypothetical protein C2S52_011252 [Perilla frutescens var. hirtella]